MKNSVLGFWAFNFEIVEGPQINRERANRRRTKDEKYMLKKNLSYPFLIHQLSLVWHLRLL
jgi:hypothetical protein